MRNSNKFLYIKTYKIMMYWYLEKWRLLLFNPNELFRISTTEKGYFEVLKFYIISSLILEAANWLLYSRFLEGILWIIIKVIFASAATFVISFFIHLGVLIFGGKQGFFNTFKPTTYVLNIWLMYSLILDILLKIIPEPLALILFFMGLTGGAIEILVKVISLFHMIIIQTKGISFFHKITKNKSFLLILTIIILLLLLYILNIFFIGSVLRLFIF